MKRQGLIKKTILGITGSFGSGKTTVSRMFKSSGIEVIDADEIAHGFLRPKGPIYKKIVDTFGEDILKKNKIIDRHKLGNIVFDNKNLIKKLNLIMHPKIIRTIKSKIKTSKAKIIILDAPLLIEAGLKKSIDKLIVVKISRKKQIERIMKKTPLDKADILRRIRHEIPLQDKVRIADFVIDNNSTIENTKKQVNRIRRLLWKN